MKNHIVEEDLNSILSDQNIPWDRFKGKTILFTGANGLLPAYMIKTLLYLNDHVSAEKNKVNIIGVVRNKTRAWQRFDGYVGRDDFNLICDDITKPIELAGDLHFIIHAASQASPKYFGTDPVGTLLPNTIGTANLLELARVKDVENFLFFSSGEVYGEVDSIQGSISETSYGYIDPTIVRSCYAESKRMGETMCVSWSEQYDVPTTIVRPFHTYGPGIRLDDGRVFADFVKNIVNNENIIMKSDGMQKRPFCYITDATRGFFYILLLGEISTAYNLANPFEYVSIKELANILINIFPEKDLKVITNNEQSNKYLRSKINEQLPDVNRLMGLGWKPTVSIAEGFNRTVRSYV